MALKTFFAAILLMFVAINTGQANTSEYIQEYFNDVASSVKATDDPVEKRKILKDSFDKMTTALDRAQRSPMLSDEDRAGIDQLISIIQEYQDELLGKNGFERVPDHKLNTFSHFVVQNMEQANRTITISLTTLLLIIIIVILLA